MTTLDILSVKQNIESYINGLNMPKEVVRMILKDIYTKVEKDAYAEAMMQAEEREKKDAES